MFPLLLSVRWDIRWQRDSTGSVAVSAPFLWLWVHSVPLEPLSKLFLFTSVWFCKNMVTCYCMSIILFWQHEPNLSSTVLGWWLVPPQWRGASTGSCFLPGAPFNCPISRKLVFLYEHFYSVYCFDLMYWLLNYLFGRVF